MKWTNAVSTTLAVLLVVACTGTAKQFSLAGKLGQAIEQDKNLALLDQQMPESLSQHGVPSIAIAYIKDGNVAWTRIYGLQTIDRQADGSTLYNTASLTKPVFAQLVLQLAAQGFVDLDEPMSNYWVDPDVAEDPRHRALTPRLALSHQAGFANWRRETGGKLAFQFEPWTKFGYSGEGYEYIAKFLERKLGRPFHQAAQEYLFAPLQMQSSSFIPLPWFSGRVAQPLGDNGNFGEPDFQENGLASDDLYTTIDDYARFLTEVIEPKLLPPELVTERQQAHVVVNQGTCVGSQASACPHIAFGLGWEIISFPNETVYMHTGADWGEKSMVFYFPETRDGAVMFTNGATGFKAIIDAGVLMFGDRRFADYLRTGGG